MKNYSVGKISAQISKHMSSIADKNAFNETIINKTIINKVEEALSGFDREAMNDGSKELGILEYCQSAVSGIYWRIDWDGTTSKHTAQSTFGDGTALADRTLVQYKADGEDNFKYWYQGVKVDVTETKSIQLVADDSKYIYYNADGNMSVADQSARDLIVKETLIAYIIATDTFGCDPYFADERHGILMDGQTHLRLHIIDGFSVIFNNGITGIANNNDTFTSFLGGGCRDEDIPKVISAITSVPKMWKDGSNWGITANDNKLAAMGTTYAQVNDISGGSGSLSDLTGNDRMGMIMVACNDSINPIRILVGQTHYSDRSVARKNVPYEWERIKTEGLPTPEITPIFTFIIDPYGNIETGSDGEIYIMNKNGQVISMY